MNPEIKRAFVWSCLVAAIVVVAGCQPAADTSGRPATVEAGGTVTYNGEPVDGASIVFAPTAGGKAAVGTTDASGNFKLMTFDPEDGAVPGTYSVTVVKRTAVPDEVSEDSEGPSAPPPEDLLPKRYGSASESGLTAEVTDGGENQFKFELTD